MYNRFLDLEGFPLLVVVHEAANVGWGPESKAESSCTLETEPKGAATSCELSGAVLLQL